MFEIKPSFGANEQLPFDHTVNQVLALTKSLIYA